MSLKLGLEVYVAVQQKGEKEDYSKKKSKDTAWQA